MKKISFVAALMMSFIAGLLFLSSSAQGAERTLIKFATLAPEGSAWMKTMREMDKTVREKSQGQVAFRLYAGGVAGDELDVLRKIRVGQIHSAAFSGVGFGGILPMVRVLDLPFLFRDYGEIDRVHEELEDYFSDRFREKGFELLSWAEVGNVHLFSQEPIRRIGDMARLKVWSWTGDPIAKETFT
ncbi:MAG: TRAP transporter substrate-binding protein DctP, partial [Deltaproteobacteria bacterium]|nr:TRAP transporter substrate-binding protein DctP [Deltaproteobacteria bacterium]